MKRNDAKEKKKDFPHLIWTTNLPAISSVTFISLCFHDYILKLLLFFLVILDAGAAFLEHRFVKENRRKGKNRKGCTKKILHTHLLLYDSFPLPQNLAFFSLWMTLAAEKSPFMVIRLDYIYFNFGLFF